MLILLDSLLQEIYQTVNMGDAVGPGGDQARTPLNESQGSQKAANQEHLERMTDYKSYAKGLMDIALLSANANQLRHALELCAPFRTLLIILLSISIVLQVIASGILLIERLTFRKEDYCKCNKYNATIGVLVLIIIVVNILATSFGGPGEECVHPLVPVAHGEVEEGSGFD